jgi:hypothetical protein
VDISCKKVGQCIDRMLSRASFGEGANTSVCSHSYRNCPREVMKYTRELISALNWCPRFIDT